VGRPTRIEAGLKQGQGSDTIAAIATGPGAGAVGIVRLSGPAVPGLIPNLFGKPLRPRTATHTSFFDLHGTPVDDGIALYFVGPNSYTGEDVLELQGHGGTAVLQGVLQACLARSNAEMPIRLARPGEFTQRAFLNHKLDLMQAEAVADLISAGSQQAVRAAMASLSGGFSQAVSEVQRGLVDLRMRLEACLDFPEEDMDLVSEQGFADGLAALQHRLDNIRAASSRGAALHRGLRVALVGPPNVGKSSLLNALAEAPVAIVTPVAGTTRDRIAQEIVIDGIPLQVVDTAGIRVTEDLVEREGVARSWESIESADLVLMVCDATAQAGDWPKPLEEEIVQRMVRVAEKEQARSGLASDPMQRLWRVYNKRDLVTEQPLSEPTGFFVSAKTGEGLEALRRALKQMAGWGQDDRGTVFSARAWQLEVLARCQACFLEAEQHLKDSALELLAEQLRLAQGLLSELTGEFVADDLLGVIFSRFCIGK
jgi:tRNA modification GTPase